MLTNVDSQLQREADHRTLKGNSELLCKTYSSVFPSTLRFNKRNLRFKVFSKLISLGFVDFNDPDRIDKIDEFKLFNARSTKKKVLDSFLKAGLIEKTGEGVYNKTYVGEAAWQSLLQFLNTHKPIEQEITDNGGKVYEYSMYEITVDEKGSCWYLRNFGFQNTSRRPLDSVEHGAFSHKAKYKDKFFHLEHSDNIESYELTENEPLRKMFNLKFRTPLKKEEYAEFWIKYNWANQYSYDNQEWTFTYYSRKSFVKEFMLRFNFPEDYVINADSIMKSNEGGALPKDCIPFNPIIIQNGNHQTMIWRIRNIPPGRRFMLSWKKKD